MHVQETQATIRSINIIFDKFEIIGGPLVVQRLGGSYELIGVVSWGKRCAEADFPGVYARVTMQLDWIKETTAERWNTCPGVHTIGIDFLLICTDSNAKHSQTELLFLVQIKRITTRICSSVSNSNKETWYSVLGTNP